MTDPTSLDVSGEPSLPLFRRGAWGRLALALLPLVAASGVVLACFYRPGSEAAWWSVASIRGGDWGVVRDLHRWGGELLLIAAWLHLFRVFMVGAYRRLAGWSVSVAGTLFAIASMVTGWFLRRGASSTIYALHVLVLPLALVVLVWLWRSLRVDTDDESESQGKTGVETEGEPAEESRS